MDRRSFLGHAASTGLLALPAATWADQVRSRAGGTVAAQRESLARATAALDRAIDVLLPREAPVLYGAQGGAERLTRSGSLLA